MLQAEGAAHDTCTCMTPVYLYLGLPCFGVNSARPLGLETPLGLDDMHGNCSLEACLRLTCGQRTFGADAVLRRDYRYAACLRRAPCCLQLEEKPDCVSASRAHT